MSQLFMVCVIFCFIWVKYIFRFKCDKVSSIPLWLFICVIFPKFFLLFKWRNFFQKKKSVHLTILYNWLCGKFFEYTNSTTLNMTSVVKIAQILFGFRMDLSILVTISSFNMSSDTVCLILFLNGLSTLTFARSLCSTVTCMLNSLMDFSEIGMYCPKFLC